MDSEEVTRVLADPVAQRLLQSPLLARLAYNGADGAPRVIPIGYLWTGSSFVMCTATVAPKVAALRRDPRVALEVDSETVPPNILLVRGTAEIEIVDGIPDEFLAASHKAVPEQQWGAFEEQVRALYPAMARISITPRWAKVLDFETRVPIAVERLARGDHPAP
jgi:pyridoxamine 5'-phosphate oxidase-like protein